MDLKFISQTRRDSSSSRLCFCSFKIKLNFTVITLLSFTVIFTFICNVFIFTINSRIISIFFIFSFFFYLLCFTVLLPPEFSNEILNFRFETFLFSGIQKREPARPQVVNRTERDGDDCAGETDDVVRHAEVGRREGDEQRLCVDPHKLLSCAIFQATTQTTYLDGFRLTSDDSL